MNKRGKKLAAALTAVMIVSAVPASAFADNISRPVSIVMNSASTPAASGGAGSSSSNGSDSNRGASDATAAVAITKDKAEQLVRQYVRIPEEYILQGTSLSSEMLADGKRRQIWSLDFVKRVNGKTMGSINASIDANSGQLYSFNTYVNNPSAKPTYPLKVDRDDAQQLAVKFIEQIASEYRDQVRFNSEYGVQILPPLTGEVRHRLRFDRMVHDIPYGNNYIEVEIDSEGHVMRFSLRWDDSITFPKIDHRLTIEEANAKLRELAEPQLRYLLPDNRQGKLEPALSYDLQAFAINASTGEIMTNPSDTYRQGTVSDEPLTEKPLDLAPRAGEITEKQAIEAVESAFGLPDGAKLINSSYYENNNDGMGNSTTQWQLYWTQMKDGKETGSVSASVDGRTGAILSFYNYNYGSNQADKPAEPLKLEEALEKAQQLVKQQLPWLTHRLHVIKPDPKQYEEVREGEYPNYYISFVHKVHGATADYDNVNVTIDGRTGGLRSFDARIAPITYSAQAPELIGKEAAVDEWMNYYRTELTYRLVQQFWWNGQPLPIEKYNVMLAAGEIIVDAVERKSEAELVYRLVPRPIEEQVFLDAESGDWRTRDKGEITQLEKQKALDIEGHWAQPQLELMVAYKALDLKEGLVRPNEQVTRGELIKMLVLARNSGGGIHFSTSSNMEKAASFNDVAADSDYFAYVESALEQNLIDLGDGSFNPDGKVSRDEMAELIVRALGYNSLANYDHIFKVSFKDSGLIEHKGQTAIVVGLKIMSLTDGKFLPKKLVTRAEAATAFFRYLQSRAELQEAPLRM